jgi:hypothetical protein
LSSSAWIVVSDTSLLYFTALTGEAIIVGEGDYLNLKLTDWVDYLISL